MNIWDTPYQQDVLGVWNRLVAMTGYDSFMLDAKAETLLFGDDYETAVTMETWRQIAELEGHSMGVVQMIATDWCHENGRDWLTLEEY